MKKQKLTRDQKLKKIALLFAAVRRAGYQAKANDQPFNPYKRGTISAYMWQAGYEQDARSIEELHADWILETGPVFELEEPII